MRISEGYDLFKIGGVPYILPYGQNIADHKRGFRLNESGLILWNGISEGLSCDELVDSLAAHYEAKPHEKSILENDVKTFLSKLIGLGVLCDTELSNNGANQVFTIGRIGVKINSPNELIHDNFKCFESLDFTESGLNITIKREYLRIRKNGQVLLRNSELCVMKDSENYIFLLPQSEQIQEAYLSLDGSNAVIYIYGEYTEKLKEDLFHAIRFLYLYKAQLCDMYMVHSASILYKDKVWLFSAPSGVGKSTHTNLWHEQFDTPFVNGDLNMLAIEDEEAIVHGIPWCGTSGIFDTKTYPLGGIVFLKRGGTNVCEELSMEEKALLLMQRMISPAWSKDMLEKNLCFAEKIAGKVPVYRLYCNKEPEAAEIMKIYIDKQEKYLD